MNSAQSPRCGIWWSTRVADPLSCFSALAAERLPQELWAEDHPAMLAYNTSSATQHSPRALPALAYALRSIPRG